MKIALTFAGSVYLIAATSMAQSPAENLKGVWVAQSGYCVESTVRVTEVEASGIVRGTFNCKRTGWTPILGEKIEKDAVKGVLTGTRFVMENADGGGFELVLEGTTLTGTSRARSSATSNPITYVRK